MAPLCLTLVTTAAVLWATTYLGDALDAVNAGLSAHTTAMVLRRWPAMLTPPPDWILCALGGNDITRVEGQRAKAQVGLDESVANLRAMRSAVSQPLISDGIGNGPDHQWLRAGHTWGVQAARPVLVMLPPQRLFHRPGRGGTTGPARQRRRAVPLQEEGMAT